MEVPEMETLVEWNVEETKRAKERQAEVERRQAEMADRLDDLLMKAPMLGYGGFETDSDWPQCRYDEVWRASVWLSGFKQRDTRPKCSSYYLKHVAEKATSRYISNGSLIAAAQLAGFAIQRVDRSPNASIAVPVRTARAASAIAENHARFADLVIIEPKLKQLATIARNYKQLSRGQDSVCANARWYGYFEWDGTGLKKQLCTLVGWESPNPILKGNHAYDVAYDALFKLLPYCKNCGCRLL